MLTFALQVLGFFYGGDAVAPPAPQPAETKEKVILVDVQVNSPEEAKRCYLSSYDKKRVELQVDFDDPLNSLTDFSMEEEPLQGPGCFMPDTKVIFKDYTYVVSLYCTSVKKYKNSAPYVTSSTPLSNDLEITESVISTLAAARKAHFGSAMNSANASKFDKREPLPKEESVDDGFLYNDDDNDDKEVEKEAEDKEGWFENQKDPELEKDETPDPQPE